MKRVVFTAPANPALRASLGQEPARSGPGRRYILYHRPSIFSLKIVPGGTVSSADKGAVKTTRSIELLRLRAWHYVSDPAGANPFGDFEAPSGQAD